MSSRWSTARYFTRAAAPLLTDLDYRKKISWL